MIELLPCPFCGGEAAIDQLGSRTMSCQVMCTDCGCRHESNDEGEASGKSWNRRHAQGALDHDKIALDAARSILDVGSDMPLVQRKARIQCIVLDALSSPDQQCPQEKANV